jgi:predicted nuclease of predicted toxin-antitoxin system
MTIWIDAQLSPALAAWLAEVFGLCAQAVRELGLRDATDREIFFAAREADAIVMSKDSDFLHLLQQHGVPPRIIWLTCGNTSNTRLKEILATTLSRALALLEEGESMVEIRSPD